jgi:hypothetical protein
MCTGKDKPTVNVPLRPATPQNGPQDTTCRNNCPGCSRNRTVIHK